MCYLFSIDAVRCIRKIFRMFLKFNQCCSKDRAVFFLGDKYKKLLFDNAFFNKIVGYFEK